MTDFAMSAQTDLKKLATGTSLAFIGSVLGNGLAYLYGIIIGRFLGAEILGLYFLALVVMQLANAICRIGLPEGLLRFIAIHMGSRDYPRAKATILSAIFLGSLTSILAGTLLFLAAEPLSVHILRQPDLAFYVKWFAVSLPFFSVFILVLNATQALKRMDLVVLSRDVLQPVLMFSLGLVGVYFIRASATSFLAAHVISMVLALGVSVYFLKRACSNLFAATASVYEWKILLAFTLPIAGGDLAHYLFRWSDTLLLSFFESASEIGIYNAALRTTLLLNLLAMSVNALYAPIIADHHHHQRLHEMEAILKTLIRWCITLALPLVAAMALLASDILRLWGPEFSPGSTVLIILGISQLIFITSNILAFTLLMSGRQYIELANTFFVATLNITMTLAFIPRYGITGAAISMLISQILVLVMRIFEIHHILGLNLYTAKYLKPVTALIPFLLLVMPFRQSTADLISFLCFGFHVLSVATMFFLFVTLYFAIVYLLGLESEDMAVWRELRLRTPAVTSGN
jgi:O-antigen/teichoic acid export membrane protein